MTTLQSIKVMGFWNTFFSGHISIGNLTIYGSNAMNWAVNFRTKKYGTICFTIPCLARFKKDRNGNRYFSWYFYVSPNGTPWASTFYRGDDKMERIKADVRKYKFGHNFNTDGKNLPDLRDRIEGILYF